MERLESCFDEEFICGVDIEIGEDFVFGVGGDGDDVVVVVGEYGGNGGGEIV